MKDDSFASFGARLIDLMGLSRPDATNEACRSFEPLALELFKLQFRSNPVYRQFCEARGVSPETLGDWRSIPAIPTAAFKELDVTSIPAAERTFVFHSSGTTEHRPSRQFHNAHSLKVYEASLLSWFFHQFEKCKVESGQSPLSGWRLIVLTPPASKAPHSSLVHMFDTIRRRLGEDESVFVGEMMGAEGWSIDFTRALSALEAVRASGPPVLILGTAFSYVHLLGHLAAHHRKFALPHNSVALETGGYKGRSRELTRRELHLEMAESLGILSECILGEYGMSELSSQAYDRHIKTRREEAKLRISNSSEGTDFVSRPFFFPPWARVQLISPETGKEVSEGETGLIRVFDLANVYSVLAIETEDLARKRGDGFELLGRAALAETRGCSLTAVG